MGEGVNMMNETMVQLRLLSALEKVFLDEAPEEKKLRLEGLRGETISFQAAFRVEKPGWQDVRVQIDSPLQRWIHVRRVRHVPVRMANYPDGDPDTLRHGAPGLYPDLLTELSPHALKLSPQWSCLWIDICPDAETPVGRYPLTIRLEREDGACIAQRTAEAEVLQAELPPQRLMLTRWFHCDGLSQYYGVEPFSERHWQLIERFLRTAVRHGMNTLLTPVHTPPLDTAVGHERLTTQLVEVFLDGGEYSFNMDKLHRWIRMAQACGVTHFEVAHLYTQWGAQHAPKIMARVDGEVRRIFGWETEAVSGEYRAFLAAYIPALRRVFREEGVEDRVLWHISDEPSAAHLDSYLAARQQVDDLLQGCTIMDALSNFAYYRQGIVEHPVVATNHAEPFLAANPPELWVYYCCAQYKRAANMFIAMPSNRSRIFGYQLFRSGATGFLHWGYNFYNCMGSHYPVDPYLDTDADCGVPAGDPFQVYPGPDGQPEESIRLMVFTHALQDLRACELLAEKAGRDFVNGLIDEAFGGELRFDTTAGDETLLALRTRINQEIRKRA